MTVSLTNPIPSHPISFYPIPLFFNICEYTLLVAQMVKNPPAVQKTQVQSLGWQDSLGTDMATHSSIPAWRIPWTEEKPLDENDTGE